MDTERGKAGVRPELPSVETDDFVVIGGSSHPELFGDIARRLGAELLDVEQGKFHSGETYVHLLESVRERRAFVLQTYGNDLMSPNDALVEHGLLLQACRLASAKETNAITPYCGYMRQDQKSVGREPISAKFLVDTLTLAGGADRILGIDLHSGQMQGFPHLKEAVFDHLPARPVLIKYILDNFSESMANDDLVLVSPDMGRAKVVKKFQEILHADFAIDLHTAIVNKEREPNTSDGKGGVSNQVRMGELLGDIDGKVALITDDMIDTGGTIVGAAEMCLEHGAREVHVMATHAVFSRDAAKRLDDSPIKTVAVTNTLPIVEEKRFSRLKVLQIGGLVAGAIFQIVKDGEGSVSRVGMESVDFSLSA